MRFNDYQKTVMVGRRAALLLAAAASLRDDEAASSTPEYALVVALLVGGAVGLMAAVNAGISSVFAGIVGTIGKNVEIVWPEQPY